MKINKLIVGFALIALPIAAVAQTSANPRPRFIPFFTGYNVQVPTNTVAQMGVTNLLFSTPQSQNVYSLTNQTVNGVAITNTIAPDAFQTIIVTPDVLGDKVANAAVVVYAGNTNLIPIAVTNSFGQYFTTNWVLSPQQYPNWMYPATTNLFPLESLIDTNVVTVSLYRVYPIKGGFGDSLATGPAVPMMQETTSTFSFSFNATGTTNICVVTNLPVAYMQGASGLRASISVGANGTGAGNPEGILINQLGIVQPQP